MSPKTFYRAAVALLLLLALLVAYLAKTQWDWLSRMEVYEHMRLANILGRSAFNFKKAFDGEIRTLAACFHPPGGSRAELGRQLAGGLAAWRAASRWPDLLAEVYLISAPPGSSAPPGNSVPSGGLALERFEAAAGSLAAAAWEPELEALRQELSRRLGGEESAVDPAGAAILDIVASVPAIVFETRLLAAPGELERAWLALHLDRDFLRRRFLPELREMIFSPPGHHEVDLAVVETASGKILYSNLPIASFADFGRSDVAFGLVDAGTDGSELPAVGLRAPPGMEALPNWTRPPSAADHAWFRRFWARDYYSGHWQLFVRKGKLALADRVAANRWRSWRISIGALALVSVAALLIFLLARRAQRLAREQMEFVASVSHELRSPLAILSAAGENLEDHLFDEPSKLREYGRLIRDEARRLSEMVENVLHLARGRSGALAVTHRPLDLGELVRDTVRRSRRQIDLAGFALEVELPAEPCRVEGNPRALGSALSNLISNALKYGLPGRWLRVLLASGGPGGRELVLAVEDRGPGIETAERSRLFEPFFRGRRARGDQVEGSGLGLAVVRQVALSHGGRVEVTSGAGGGSRFELYLPRLEAK